MAYTQKTWEKDELIEASDLNNIEQGIKDNENDISILEDRATEDEDNVATLENLVNANKEELDNTIEQNAKDDDARLTALEERAKTDEIEIENKISKNAVGTSESVSIETAGYITNSGKDVIFTVPITIHDNEISNIELTTIRLRQNGQYLRGSSTGYVDFDGTVESWEQTIVGTRITLRWGDPITTGITDAKNNDTIGVYCDAVFTFKEPESESDNDPDEGSDDDNN